LVSRPEVLDAAVTYIDGFIDFYESSLEGMGTDPNSP